MLTERTKTVASASTSGATQLPIKLRSRQANAALVGNIATSPGLDLLSHGSMHVHLYAPHGIDPQGPHDQDELYFISRGRGLFRRGDEEVSFSSGDALFVPAQTFHCFLDFSDDFEAWVVLWGPTSAESHTATAPPAEHRGKTKHV